ncbi:hypothetical protein BGZ63DRAFT_437023 [Mariannaea sp. PMI_226]|nr:hypothetical protein BGZ63DRAFT_437023 [Mariannaea sp. PMI_226]
MATTMVLGQTICCQHVRLVIRLFSLPRLPWRLGTQLGTKALAVEPWSTSNSSVIQCTRRLAGVAGGPPGHSAAKKYLLGTCQTTPGPISPVNPSTRSPSRPPLSPNRLKVNNQVAAALHLALVASGVGLCLPASLTFLSSCLIPSLPISFRLRRTLFLPPPETDQAQGV